MRLAELLREQPHLGDLKLIRLSGGPTERQAANNVFGFVAGGIHIAFLG